MDTIVMTNVSGSTLAVSDLGISINNVVLDSTETLNRNIDGRVESITHSTT